MKPFIVKVQLSLSTSDGVRRCLIYSKDRGVFSEEEATSEIIEHVNGELKSYWMAQLTDEGIELIAQAKEQSW